MRSTSATRSRFSPTVAISPSTLKPLISAAVSQSIRPFTTKRKSPSVSSVTGNVSKTNRGRNTAFTNPSTSAAIVAVAHTCTTASR